MVASLLPPAYSGAGLQAVALAAQLQERDVVVHLLTYNRVLAPRREVIEGVSVWRCGGERLVRKLPPQLKEWARLAIFAAWLCTRLLIGRYDVYHVHGNYLYALPVAVVGRLRRVPLVVKVTLLGDDDAGTHARRRRGFRWLFNLASRTASTLVATNPEVARRHRTRFPRVPVAEVPNGVDVARFAATPTTRASARRALDLEAGTFVALFVGYLTERKGLTDLVQGWLAFASARPPGSPDAVLLLVGPRQDFNSNFAAGGLALATSPAAEQAGIRLLGHVPPERMPETYACADLFVLPTYGEGMPNSLLEALAAGLPAIVTDVPGVAEIAAHDRENVLVSPGSPSEIAEALFDFASQHGGSGSPPRASRLAHQYSLAHTADQYRELYTHLAT